MSVSRYGLRSGISTNIETVAAPTGLQSLSLDSEDEREDSLQVKDYASVTSKKSALASPIEQQTLVAASAGT